MKEKLLTTAIKLEMKKNDILKTAKEVLRKEDGMTMLEIAGVISVVLIILTVLYAFGDKIIDFFNRSGARVDSFQVQ